MRALPAPRRPSQRGAALLTALLIVVLVTTLSAAMLWRQARSIQIEIADRGRAQADWVLQGALDWARLILREDGLANTRASSGASDNLGEVWAVPLAEARLSSFLAQDDNKSADAGPDAFLSGHIEDAQALFNLRNLEEQAPSNDTAALAKQAFHLNAARRIFVRAGMSASLAEDVRKKLIAASTAGKGEPGQGNTPLRPARIEQLRWFGLNDEQVARLAKFAVLLPASTPLNVNTAQREVLADVLGVDLGVADAIVRTRQSKAFTATTMDRFKSLLPQDVATASAAVTAATTSYFFVEGQLRMDDRVLAQRSLVSRGNGNDIQVRDRQRLQRFAALPGAPGGGATP